MWAETEAQDSINGGTWPQFSFTTLLHVFIGLIFLNDGLNDYIDHLIIDFRRFSKENLLEI
jgi:hypothetical protein